MDKRKDDRLVLVGNTPEVLWLHRDSAELPELLKQGWFIHATYDGPDNTEGAFVMLLRSLH